MTEASNQLKGFSPVIAQPIVAVLVGAGVSRGLGFSLMGGDDYEALRGKFQEELEAAGCDGILDHVDLLDPREPNLEDVFEQITLISRSAETLKNCQHGCSIACDAKKAEEGIALFVARHYGFPQAGRGKATALYTEWLEAIWPATDGKAPSSRRTMTSR